MSLVLPQQANLAKKIPKKKFFENADVKSKIKQKFVDYIQTIIWKYKLSPLTINIKDTEQVPEIQIFEIYLKEYYIPEDVLKIIDKAIKTPVLYKFLYNENFCYAIGYDRQSKTKFYYSEWNEELDFDFNHLNLEKLYQNLIKEFIKIPKSEDQDFEEAIQKDDQIKHLEKEIYTLNKKVKSEKQFNKKVELNKQLNMKKQEYDKLV